MRGTFVDSVYFTIFHKKMGDHVLRNYDVGIRALGL